MEVNRKIPSIQAGCRCERYGMAANHHLRDVAEFIVENTGTLLRDVNGSGEYLEGQLSRESPEALA